MNKIEIDTTKLKKTIRKAIPWVIGGGLAIAGGIILYKKGFLKGTVVGTKHAITRITDYLGASVDNACIYNNSNNIPVVIKGIAVTSEADIPIATELLKVASTEAGDGVELAKSLSEIVLKK